MPRPPAPLSASLSTSFTVREARAAGASDRRLRARDLEAPFRGIRIRRQDLPADDPVRRHLTLARAFAKDMPSETAFSHLTAALIWALPVPVPDRLDVVSISPRRALRAKGVRGRRARAELTEILTVGELQVCSPATTWAQLGALVGDALVPDDLVVAGDAIVRAPRRRSGHAGDPRGALATLDDLRTAMTAGRRAGAPALRSALADVREGSSSPQETRLRLAIVRAGLPEPDIDVEIYGARGEFVGVADAAYLRWKVLVEYEGQHHLTDPRQWDRDIEKYAQCEAMGLTVVRITAAHLRRTGNAVGRVREALLRNGWRPHAT